MPANRSGQATGGLGGLNPPTVLRGHSRHLHRTDEKILGVSPRNVVHANTLVLVAHLVTFSESQCDQFHPRAKKPTAPWGSPFTPSAALPLDPAGDSAAHSSPCTFSLTPPAELRQNKQRKRSPHHKIKFVTNHYICNKCNNEVNFYRASWTNPNTVFKVTPVFTNLYFTIQW